MASYTVRPFRLADRSRLLSIGAETAFFGSPIERYMDDRRVFEDGFYAYYTDYEPQHAWVAIRQEDEQETVVGFLTGCTDPARHSKAMRKIILRVLLKQIRGQYRIRYKTCRYAWRVLLSKWRGEFPQVDEIRYPAHLHINLLKHARGKGLGKALMEAYLNQVRTLGLPGVHLNTTSMNVSAIRLYERTGFSLLDARRTRTWEGIISGPVENRAYGLSLKT